MTLHAQYGADLIALGRDQSVADDAGASAGFDPGRGGANLAICGGHRDFGAEADDVVEFQVLDEHPV
jgi:hypothetical protein